MLLLATRRRGRQIWRSDFTRCKMQIFPNLNITLMLAIPRCPWQAFHTRTVLNLNSSDVNEARRGSMSKPKKEVGSSHWLTVLTANNGWNGGGHRDDSLSIRRLEAKQNEMNLAPLGLTSTYKTSSIRFITSSSALHLLLSNSYTGASIFIAPNSIHHRSSSFASLSTLHTTLTFPEISWTFKLSLLLSSCLKVRGLLTVTLLCDNLTLL